MLINQRPDGSPVKVPGFMKLLPILMPSRTESSLYMAQELELNETLAFIERWNETLPEGRRPLTLMQVLLSAMARAVAERPWINRFVSNGRHYQRNNISFSFVSRKDHSDNGEEVTVTMPFRPNDGLDAVNERFSRFVGQAKSEEGNKSDADVDLFERLPVPALRLIVAGLRFLDRHNLVNRSLLRLLPFYCTAFVTNVASLGIDAPSHHNFELGNTGLFVALGKVNRAKTLDGDGATVERAWTTVTYTFDERIVDGGYGARTINLIKELVEDPRRLVEPATLSEKQTRDLALTEEGWKLWAS